MPSCTRFALYIIFSGLTGYVALLVLAALVEPQQREMTTSVALRPVTTDNVKPRTADTMQRGLEVSLYQGLEDRPLSSR